MKRTILSRSGRSLSLLVAICASFAFVLPVCAAPKRVLVVTVTKAFLDWIKSGKAFIGMHSASDTLHNTPYVEMLGGEFETHHAQVEVDCINESAKHLACSHLGPTFHVKDEIYLIKNFERSKVHPLLMLD